MVWIMEQVDLVLVDINTELTDELRQAFRGTNVRVENDRFEALDDGSLPNAVMVSAANSFGLMDGGVDGAITRFFGDQLQKRVQREILGCWHGEQPVGTSFILEAWDNSNTKYNIEESGYGWLAHTPTMRIPSDISQTDNVYLAMKAMLRAVYAFNYSPMIGVSGDLTTHTPRYDHQRIKTIVCPGLGTSAGRVPFQEAARQMRLAYSTFFDVPAELNWNYAAAIQHAVNGGVARV